MKEKNDIVNKIEETLNSLDGIKRAEANPFLYTRIRSRLQEPRTGLERFVLIAGKPVFAFLVLLIVLGTNLMVMLNRSAEVAATQQEQTQFAVADEYQLDVPSLYDYENPEP